MKPSLKLKNAGKLPWNKINKNYGGNANKSGLGFKIKSALRQVAHRKDGALKVKNEAALQAETLNGNKPDKTAEEAYYGEIETRKTKVNTKIKVKVKLGYLTTSRHKRRPGMLADPLTKMKADASNLTNLLRTGTWKKPA